MSKKAYSFRELCKIIDANGYKLIRASGSHRIFKHTLTSKMLVLPRHKNMNNVFVHKLIKQYGLQVRR